jgi:hypothetical protein
MAANEVDATVTPVAVIMERQALANRWVSERWEASGVVLDADPPGTPPRVIVEQKELTQTLFPGFRLRLLREDAEGYYLNITSPSPKVFILWRMHDDGPRPEFVTVCYFEGTRWADSGEQVDGVKLPTELRPWIERFVAEHYHPEPRKPRRYASSRDKGRMGR